MSRGVAVGMVLAGLALLVGIGQSRAAQSAPKQREVPIFEVDPSWPKLPANLKLGEVSSIAIDRQDHALILHRPRTVPEGQRAMAAPPVVEIDQAGNFVRGWGGPGPGFEWPEREHGIHADSRGYVWISGNNCLERKLPGLKPLADDQVLQFTSDGKFVKQIGRSNQSKGNGDTRNLQQPADMLFYPTTNELFVADGYGNHRVIVFDADTGAFKRMWGAYGNTPADAFRCVGPLPGEPFPTEGRGPEQFTIAHAVRISGDGLVYLADSVAGRVQVFTIDGKFVTEVFIKRKEMGAPRGLGFSSDPGQQFLYVGSTAEVVILDRKTLEIVSTFGRQGSKPGEFLSAVGTPDPHYVATDSKGNIYTAGGYGRVQKFIFKGLSSSAPTR
jgi:DNA-binding beta-propeller fold protein YncE